MVPRRARARPLFHLFDPGALVDVRVPYIVPWSTGGILACRGKQYKVVKFCAGVKRALGATKEPMHFDHYVLREVVQSAAGEVKVPPEAVVGAFSSGLFGCTDDCGSCLAVACCLPITTAQLFSK